MEVFLIRHTTPFVEKGICYGQSDVGVADSFANEANQIQQYLPSKVPHVCSSPLLRCKKLAEYLFPQHHISFYPELMEMNFGSWEMKSWNKLPESITSAWMNDFVHTAVPSGESYLQLYERSSKIFQQIIALHTSAAIITHGGVIRSILSMITDTELSHSFNQFKIKYGCVVKITKEKSELHYKIEYAGC